MNTIYKYALPARTGWVEVSLPVSARVIHVETSLGEICLWAIVDGDQTETEKRKFFVAGTGQPLAQDLLHYYGTAHDGNFVWHVFS